MADLLRFYLQAANTEFISLQEELSHVEPYLDIQQLRFAARLEYHLSSPREGSIPPLLIQPLVENSIKHNINMVKKLIITIGISTVPGVPVLRSLRPKHSQFPLKGT